MINLALHKDIIDQVCNAYAINTPLRKAHFLAQVDHESNGFNTLIENLNYSSTALLTTFSRHRISEDDCKRYGRRSGHKADQVMIANIVYGGAWGFRNLGNTIHGHGWKYRGRGAMQCTGLTNYRSYSEYKGEDFVTNPDLLLTSPFWLDFAGYYWHIKKLNNLADRDDLKSITKSINGGLIGLDHRALLLHQYKKLI